MVEEYPRNLTELEARFGTEEACRAYLARLRWPDGFRCPRCGGERSWPVRAVLLECAGCGCQTSVTAGTIFQDTRTPLPIWFQAMWWVTTQKNGASALGLQRVLGLRKYETAWTMLHKLRRAMVRPGRDLLTGRIEVDESYVGSEEKGLPGRLNLKKALVVVATDGWLGYLPAERNGYQHEVTFLKGKKKTPSELMPRVHRVFSLLKRWLLGTHQGAVSQKHLDYYLDEFTFRFNRRRSRSRGKLFFRLAQQAVAVDPVPYDHLVHPTPTKAKPQYVGVT